jgi:hypothetical protein
VKIGVMVLVAFAIGCGPGGGCGLAAAKDPQRPTVQVTVDPRVELVSIIFRLAGHPEYNQGRVESYAEDVESHFGPFREHRVVELARKLRRSRSVSYDACMSMAVHVSDAVELREKVPLAPRPEGLDGRWTPDDAREFLAAARQFVRDSAFEDFLRKHRSLYETTQSRMKTLLEKEGHMEWFDRFFGDRPGARFSVALGLLNGGQCYGPHCRNADGKDELYCILGVWQTDDQGLPRFTGDVLKTVVHEFCHSYANPIIDRHEAELKPAGERIFSHVKEAMKRQAYGEWKTVMYESLVRASTLRYIRQYDGEPAAQMAIQHERSRSFRWIGTLSDLLGEYEADRRRYPTLDSFSPRLVEFFNVCADQMDERAKKQQ